MFFSRMGVALHDTHGHSHGGGGHSHKHPNTKTITIADTVDTPLLADKSSSQVRQTVDIFIYLKNLYSALFTTQCTLMCYNSSYIKHENYTVCIVLHCIALYYEALY